MEAIKEPMEPVFEAMANRISRRVIDEAIYTCRDLLSEQLRGPALDLDGFLDELSEVVK